MKVRLGADGHTCDQTHNGPPRSHNRRQILRSQFFLDFSPLPGGKSAKFLLRDVLPNRIEGNAYS